MSSPLLPFVQFWTCVFVVYSVVIVCCSRRGSLSPTSKPLNKTRVRISFFVCWLFVYILVAHYLDLALLLLSFCLVSCCNYHDEDGADDGVTTLLFERASFSRDHFAFCCTVTVRPTPHPGVFVFCFSLLLLFCYLFSWWPPVLLRSSTCSCCLVVVFLGAKALLRSVLGGVFFLKQGE